MCVLALEQAEETVKHTLVLGSAKDFKKLKGYKEKGNGEYKELFGYRYGIPFWLKSMKTEKIEDHCNIFSEDTNKENFAEWLKFDMVYIPKNLKRS